MTQKLTTEAQLWAATRRRDDAINAIFAALKDEEANLVNGAADRLRALLRNTAVVGNDEWASLPTYAAVEADRQRVAARNAA